jgi:penicillin-binding protein 1A
MEAATGAVRAMVGGRDWEARQINRAVQANRNMGSVLKPVLYLTAMEKLGVHPATLSEDSILVVDIPGTALWAPTNFEDRYQGRTILKSALAHSINTVAVRLILAVQPEAMVETLHRFQVQSPVLPHYSLALGGVPVTAVELAAIGGSIANLGEVIEPFYVRRIEDDSGTILEEHIASRRNSFDPEVVYLLADMMKGVMESGTAAETKDLGFTLPAIGKTGTTNDFRDSWFFGSTTQLSASAWVGFDDNRQMIDKDEEGITGAAGAMPIWVRFMNLATEGEPPREFLPPPGIEFASVSPWKGTRMNRQQGTVDLALPEGVTLPDSTLLKLEAAWGDTIMVDSLGTVMLQEVMP